MKTIIISLTICFTSIFYISSVAQMAPYHDYICPSLYGVYNNGDRVKNADGKVWRVTTSNHSSIEVTGDVRPILTVEKTGSRKVLVCRTTISGKTIKATYEVTYPANYCKPVPEPNYALFGCY